MLKLEKIHYSRVRYVLNNIIKLLTENLSHMKNFEKMFENEVRNINNVIYNTKIEFEKEINNNEDILKDLVIVKLLIKTYETFINNKLKETIKYDNYCFQEISDNFIIDDVKFDFKKFLQKHFNLNVNNIVYSKKNTYIIDNIKESDDIIKDILDKLKLPNVTEKINQINIIKKNNFEEVFRVCISKLQQQ